VVWANLVHWSPPNQRAVSTLASSTRLKTDFQGYLIDGFPIHMGQAEIFVDQIGTPTRVIALEAADEVLTGRLLARGNFDDTPESVAKRITNYCTNTKPVIEKFNAMVINVERPADEIFAEVQKLF